MGTSSDNRDQHDRESQPRRVTQDEADSLDRSRRQEKTKKILKDADHRDENADARDAAADERERVADFDAFTDPTPTYPGHQERRAAVHDRSKSKDDREHSAEDRRQLSKEDD